VTETLDFNMTENTHSTAETILEEAIAKLVSTIHSHSATPNAAPAISPTVSDPTSPVGVGATLAALTPSAAHVAHARALGIDPAQLCAVVRQHISGVVESLKQLGHTMPAGDLNIVAVNDLIARLS
jgi:hypothetical protein